MIVNPIANHRHSIRLHLDLSYYNRGSFGKEAAVQLQAIAPFESRVPEVRREYRVQPVQALEKEYRCVFYSQGSNIYQSQGFATEKATHSPGQFSATPERRFSSHFFSSGLPAHPYPVTKGTMKAEKTHYSLATPSSGSQMGHNISSPTLVALPSGAMRLRLLSRQPLTEIRSMDDADGRSRGHEHSVPLAPVLGQSAHAVTRQAAEALPGAGKDLPVVKTAIEGERFSDSLATPTIEMRRGHTIASPTLVASPKEAMRLKPFSRQPLKDFRSTDDAAGGSPGHEHSVPLVPILVQSASSVRSRLEVHEENLLPAAESDGKTGSSEQGRLAHAVTEKFAESVWQSRKDKAQAAMSLPPLRSWGTTQSNASSLQSPLKIWPEVRLGTHRQMALLHNDLRLMKSHGSPTIKGTVKTMTATDTASERLAMSAGSHSPLSSSIPVLQTEEHGANLQSARRYHRSAVETRQTSATGSPHMGHISASLIGGGRSIGIINTGAAPSAISLTTLLPGIPTTIFHPKGGDTEMLIAPVTAGPFMQASRGENVAHEADTDAGSWQSIGRTNTEESAPYIPSTIRARKLSSIGLPASATPSMHAGVDQIPEPLQASSWGSRSTPGSGSGRVPHLVHKRPILPSAAGQDPSAGLPAATGAPDSSQGIVTQTVLQGTTDTTGVGTLDRTAQQLSASGQQLHIPPMEVNRIANDVYRLIEKKLMVERERRGL